MKMLHIRKLSRPVALIALLIVGPADATDDSRRVRSADSPAWLFAVGRLEIPGSRYERGRRQHHTETCSATLLADSSEAGRPLLLTAWHCLEYYNDLSRPLTVTLKTQNGDTHQREVFRLADGGGMHADWALLGLRGALPDPALPRIALLRGDAKPGQSIVMAGFSRDPGLGEHGEALTYDPDCRITARARFNTATNCRAHKGASGGAVVQQDENHQSYLAGVISEGDGEGYSAFVPVAHFRSKLAAY